MTRDFPLFVDIIRNVEMALAKSDFGIARLYASLVEDEALRDRVFTTLEAEFNLTHRMILEITEQKTLLQTNPVLERSIRLRNPYVDPMSLIQVELIRRKRSRHQRTANPTPPNSTAPSPPPSTASAPASATPADPLCNGFPYRVRYCHGDIAHIEDLHHQPAARTRSQGRVSRPSR